MKYSEKSHKMVINSDIPIVVKIGDISKNSHIKIQYQCDNCGEIFTTTWCIWNRKKYKELGDLCLSCTAKIKLPVAMEDKYGTDNSAHIQEFVDKKKQTNLEKYGTEWAIASKEVKEHIKSTMLTRYNVENAMKCEFVKEKAKNTNLIKYGGFSALCDSEVKEKSRQTCLKKYGVPNAFQCKEIQAKAQRTLKSNGTAPSSKAEKRLCSILKEMYGESHCFPSTPEGQLTLDCLLVFDENKIDVEYDGNFWHKDNAQKDAARNAVLMNNGYKVLRVKGNNRDEMPTKEQIQEAIDYLVKDNHHLVFIDMNN